MSDKERIATLQTKLAEAEAERDAAHRNFIDAWEALPGGQNYSGHRIERWLIEDMKPAVDRARAGLTKPETPRE